MEGERDSLINRAVTLESLDTGLSEKEIRQTYDLMELVKKWLRILGIKVEDPMAMEKMLLLSCDEVERQEIYCTIDSAA